jgi:Tol biopolymer transport system component
MIKIRGKYLTTLLLCLTVSVLTMGAVLSYSVSMPSGTKTLSLPTDMNADYGVQLSNPKVTRIRTLEGVENIEGCLGNKIVFFPYGNDVESGKSNGTTLYDLDSDDRNLIYADNKIMYSSATLGMFSTSQDKTKIILNDKSFWESGHPFGVYVYDVNKENAFKVTDISKEFTIPTERALGEGETIIYTSYNGSGWSADGERIVYCIKNSNENIFDFFIYNIKANSTEKYSLANFEYNFITISMPKLSNDGKYIYFTGHCDATPLVDSLYRIDLTKKEKKAEWLTDHADYFYLSNDGRKIVYTHCRLNSPKRKIYIFDTLTKEEKVLIDNPFSLFDISADGNKIVYTVNDDDSIDVKMAYIENDSISNSTTLYRAGLNESIGLAFWNHDGSKIVVRGDYGKNYIIELEYGDQN